MMSQDDIKVAASAIHKATLPDKVLLQATVIALIHENPELEEKIRNALLHLGVSAGIEGKEEIQEAASAATLLINHASKRSNRMTGPILPERTATKK